MRKKLKMEKNVKDHKCKIAMIMLDVNDLNTPNKRQRLTAQAFYCEKSSHQVSDLGQK